MPGVVFLENLFTERMEGGNMRRSFRLAQGFADANPHLFRRLARVSKGKNVLRLKPGNGAQQVEDAAGHDAGFAAARPGDNQQRSLAVFDRFLLLGVLGLFRHGSSSHARTMHRQGDHCGCAPVAFRLKFLKSGASLLVVRVKFESCLIFFHGFLRFSVHAIEVAEHEVRPAVPRIQASAPFNAFSASSVWLSSR